MSEEGRQVVVKTAKDLGAFALRPDCGLVPPEFEFTELSRTPAVAGEEATWLGPECVETPLPIDRGGPTEPSAEVQAWKPESTFRTVTVLSGQDAQVTGPLPYRRLVRVLAIGDAARVTFAFRPRHEGESMLVVKESDLPFDILVCPRQELFIRHDTGVDQECSFVIEPCVGGR